MTTVIADIGLAEAAGADNEVFVPLLLPQAARSNARTTVANAAARVEEAE